MNRHVRKWVRLIRESETEAGAVAIAELLIESVSHSTASAVLSPILGKEDLSEATYARLPGGAMDGVRRGLANIKDIDA